MRRHLAVIALLVVGLGGLAHPAHAQQPLNDVLSFLLTNRSVPTGDFAGDAAAAAAARDAIVRLLLSELTSRPISSPASGFTYRLDPTLGADVRSSNSFGPFFVERSLTSGRHRASFGLGYTVADFETIDGRDLRNGTLVATASRLTDDVDAFDAETLTLRMQARTLTLSGLVGVTDRFDLTATVPFTTIHLNGERVDTYRGTSVVQATAVASASGIGDVLVRGKYNVWRKGASGLALGAEARLPTGDSGNLLGSGRAVFAPRIMASAERDRLAAHGNLGYSRGGPSDALDFAGALTVAGASRLTLILELSGRRLNSSGRLAYVSAAHPSLVGVDTIRLIGTQEVATRLGIAAGFRWNIAERWLLNVNVIRPLTSTGLNAPWVPTVTFDYSLGG